MPSLGDRIRARRTALRLTQTQLAAGKLSKGFISLLESGRARPSADTLLLLAQVLQVSPTTLLGDGEPWGADYLTEIVTKAVRLTLDGAWKTARAGDVTRGAERFKEALLLLARRPDRRAQAESYIGLAYTLANLRQFELAEQNIRLGKDIAIELEDRSNLVRVSHVLALIAYNRRRFQEARDHLLEGYRHYQEWGHPDRSLGGAFLHNLGNTYLELGEVAEAVQWFRQALPLTEAAKDWHRMGWVHLQLGVAHRERGEHEESLAEINRALGMFESLGDRRYMGWAHNSMGITLRVAGRIDEALEHLEESLRIKAEIGDDPGRGRTLTDVGLALTARRAFPEAERAFAEAGRLATRFEDVTAGARLEYARAQLLLAKGDVSEAIEAFERAVSSFEALRMRADVARACKVLGELLMQHNRPREAAQYLLRALDALTLRREAPVSSA